MGVWRAPASGPNSHSVWAPELHYLKGRWYLYNSTSAQRHDDDTHRHSFVLENASDDPTRGAWVDKGMLKTTTPASTALCSSFAGGSISSTPPTSAITAT